jgi:hypothetical protein
MAGMVNIGRIPNVDLDLDGIRRKISESRTEGWIFGKNQRSLGMLGHSRMAFINSSGYAYTDTRLAFL